MKKNIQKIIYRSKGLKHIVLENKLQVNISMIMVWIIFLKYFLTNGRSFSPFYLIEKQIYENLNDIVILDGIKILKPFKFSEFRILVYEFYDLIFPYISDLSEYNNMDLGEGTYEHMSVMVEQGDVVIDAGANFGLFSLFSILKRGARKVIAFEPSYEALKYLRANLDLNQISDRVFIYEKALSFNSSELPFQFNDENFGGGKIALISSQSTIMILTVSLDSTINECVQFIKADIEGFERYLLLGALNTITNCNPKIAICSYHYKYDDELLEGILKLINPAYKIYHASGKLYASI